MTCNFVNNYYNVIVVHRDNIIIIYKKYLTRNERNKAYYSLENNHATYR